MGWSESHISLKCQRYMTFTPSHQLIFIELLFFPDFFLTLTDLGAADRGHAITRMMAPVSCSRGTCTVKHWNVRREYIKVKRGVTYVEHAGAVSRVGAEQEGSCNYSIYSIDK